MLSNSIYLQDCTLSDILCIVTNENGLSGKERMESLLAPGPFMGDEDWQLSKDSADAATVSSDLKMSLERKEKAESKP